MWRCGCTALKLKKVLAMKKTALPPELSALVHHVELNKSGWWDKAIQRIILTASYRINSEFTAAEMLNVLSNDFSVHIDLQKIEKQITTLERTNDLIRVIIYLTHPSNRAIN